MAQSNSKTIEDQLTLEYHGDPVKAGRMDSYEVAAYIIAFSDFLGTVSRKTYGEKIDIKTEIQGFRKDSFDIDFAFRMGVVTAMLLTQTPLSVKEFIELIRECVKAWIHLNGKPPKSMLPDSNNKNNLEIENQNGEVFYTTINVTNIITDLRAGEAAERFIRKPLEAGLSYIRINSKTDGEVAKIEEKDASSFVPIVVEKTSLIEQEMQMTLLIESPVFKEGNKWRFSDGQSSFYADIVDEEFLKKVDSGMERFGKGDQLMAKVRFVQSGIFGSLKLERTIIQVLEHQTPQEKQQLIQFNSSKK